jgi:chromosome partitioning protein
MSHLSARQEYRQLLDALRLPVSERTEARRAALAAWTENEKAPLQFDHMAG